MNNANFNQVVQDSWQQPAEGTKMFQVCSKLKRLKPDLKNLTMKYYNAISERVTLTKHELDALQKTLQQEGVDAQLRRKEVDLKIKYVLLRATEEDYCRQNSRAKWLDVGDKNTAYFYKKVNGHRACNKDMSIRDNKGTRIEGEEAVHKEAIKHFSAFLGITQETAQEMTADSVDRPATLGMQLTPEQCQHLEAHVTREEVRKVMFSIANNKAPGPDGYNASFFKKIGNWVEMKS